MNDQLSAAEVLYGRGVRNDVAPPSIGDDWHAERGMKFISDGLKSAITTARNKGQVDPDPVWLGDAEKAGGMMAYFGKENADALRSFATAVSRANEQPIAEEAYPRNGEPKTDIHLVGIAESLMKLGGGVPKLVRSPSGATQFIFPNGMVLRFDIEPGQYKPGTGPGKGPHINLQWPGIYNEHIKLLP